MSSRSRADVQQEVAHLLANFNGKEYSEPITPQTLFFGDLGMASIDAVLLAETLENRYGQRFPFQQLLAQMAHTEVLDFTVGQLTDFLYSHLTGA